MKKNRSPHLLSTPVSRSRISWILAVLFVLVLAAGLLTIRSEPVAASAQPSTHQNNQAAPTALPSSNNPAPSANVAPSAGTSPLVGILVLLTPFVFLVWKSRGRKEPQTRASCCAPVIDEDKRPFQPQDDLPAVQKSRRA